MVDKQPMSHSYNGILLSNKKEWTDACSHTLHDILEKGKL